MTSHPPSARLRLRRLAFTDAPFLVRLLNEPAFLRHIGDKGVRTLDDARHYLAHGPMDCHVRHGFGLDCVELPCGTPIGICGLVKRASLEIPDLGYAFLSEYWGRGYAAEAVNLVLRDARDRLGLRRVAAVVAPGNARSIRLLERAGFVSGGLVRLVPDGPEIRLFNVELLQNEDS
jgi:RimJ/RimL family protein N-acetyltransferase